jgi:hypothetical protein
LGLRLLFQGRSTLPYVRHSPTTPSPLSRERVVFRRLLIQSHHSPLPSLLGTTLVSPARRERHLPVSHGLRSLFPFPSLSFQYCPLFYHISPLYSRLPEQVPAPSAMPTSSGAHARALQTATGIPAPEQAHPAAASSARSEQPRPIRLYEGASFSPERLHNRPEAARYLLTLVTTCSDRDTHTLSKFS